MDNAFRKYIKCRVTGKVSFPTRAEAEWVRLSLRWSNSFAYDKIIGKRIKHRRGKSSATRVYYCEYCQGYHLTSWKEWHYKKYKAWRDSEGI